MRMDASSPSYEECHMYVDLYTLPYAYTVATAP